MGIKGFSKVFKNGTQVKEDIIYGKIIIIDAMNEIYKAEKSPFILTGPDGDTTHALKIIIDNIIRRKNNNVKEIWCFDYYEINYINPLKMEEHNIRKQQKEKAQKEANLIENSLNCTEIDDDEKYELKKILFKKNKENITLSAKRINEIKYVLNCLNIPYLMAPKGFESEQICALLSKYNVVDYVITNDYDTLLFGAKNIVKSYTDRKLKKKIIMLYELKKILHDHDINECELAMIGIILGCDFYKDINKLFKGIGPKTVIKRIRDQNIINIFETNEDINEKLHYFISYEKMFNYDSVNILKTKLDNEFNKPINKNEINKLINWLINKGFNSEKITNLFGHICRKYA